MADNNYIAVIHHNENDEALCGRASSHLTRYPKLVTCKKCLELKPCTEKPKRQIIKRIPATKRPILSDEKRSEIYLYWSTHPNNTKPEIAVRFGCTVWQVDYILNERLKKKTA